MSRHNGLKTGNVMPTASSGVGYGLSNFRKKLNMLAPADSGPHPRILSVDALRGFDMFWISGGGAVFLSLHRVVKSPVTAAIANQLDHVPWIGFHFWDLIMPLFLFLVGVAMVFSLNRRLSTSSRADIWIHITRRVVILWILGMVVQGHLLTYDFRQFAFYSNTLQTIAVGYLISSVLIMYLDVSGQIIATIGLLLLYGLIIAFVPIPGIGHPVLEPEQNIALYFDKLILGTHQDGTYYTWILSSLNFGSMVMTGVFASYILQAKTSPMRKVWVLLMTGIALVGSGLLISTVQPIIKHIYTSSFVLLAAGFCFILLAVFYLVVDCFKWTSWAFFFIVIGSNSIFAYVLAELYNFSGFANVFLGGLKPHVGIWYPVLLTVGTYGVFWLILWHLYRQKMFIKI